MSELEKPQPYLSADFGEHGGHYEWMTHEEAMTWITQLQNQWSWISQQSHNPPHQAWQSIANPLTNATNTLQQAQNLRNQGQIESANNHVASAGSILEGFIRGNSWLLDKAAQRKFVEELRDTGRPLESALIVCYWMKLDLSGAPIQAVVSGLLQWELYERGIKDRIKNENAALKRLAADMQSTLTQFHEAERTQLSASMNCMAGLLNSLRNINGLLMHIKRQGLTIGKSNSTTLRLN